MTGPATVRVAARAKLNLVLDLLGPRPDGYTEIATVFQEVDLADDVEVRVDAGGTGIALETAGGDEPCPPEQNLGWRAAALYAERFGAPGRVEIRITKRIPAGAGLGGGSSDAAAVLRALSRLSARPPEPAALAAAAARLGADVPYFLLGGTAVGRGRGDELEALPDAPSWPCVLARDGRPLATADVYNAARAGLTPRGDAPNIRKFLRHLRERPDTIPPLGNDLLPAAARLEPAIPVLIRTLEEAGGHASMTGSGSTVFALFSSAGPAAAAAAALRHRHGAAFVAETRTTGRADRAG